MAGKKDKPGKPSPVKVVDEDEKKKALKAAIAHIEKQYGKGAVMKLGETPEMNVAVIPTGSLTLDMALGVGGLPRGRIVEIFGPESSGKTTVALHCAAEAQKQGGNVAFIDVEHALDPVYAKSLGVNIDDLLVSQPDSGEQALEIAEELIRSGAIDLIVVDSVAAMVTKAEIDGMMGDNHVGLLARLMSQAMRKLTSVISKTNCVAIFINQIREKVGIVYGNPETTPGGRALKFYASVRLDVRPGDPIKSKDGIIGKQMKIKVSKNKVSPPFKTAVVDLLFGTGIDRMGEVVDIAVDLDIIHKSGAWFSYGPDKIGQGREKTKEFLRAHPETLEEIEAKIAENRDKVLERVAGDEEEDKSEAAASEEGGDIIAQIDDSASGSPIEPVSAVNIDIEADDNYEAFDPA
ncbi:MAG: recombinase RecA [Oscillospiraceae bacterium]|nr:recombinase RecA [Oscillospiraceae bacterium]